MSQLVFVRPKSTFHVGNLHFDEGNVTSSSGSMQKQWSAINDECLFIVTCVMQKNRQITGSFDLCQQALARAVQAILSRYFLQMH